MEYLEGKLKCGCYAKTTFNPANYVLELCPLHKAALEMYEALQVALGVIATVLWEHPDDEIAQAKKVVIEQALAKAEGE